jgi:chemotaxis signal transduction protein
MTEAGGLPSTTALQSQQERIEAVWRERAKRLSQRPVFVGSRSDASTVMVLEIGRERYGIDLSDVAEVLPPVRATPVPGAAAVFSGVVNVHGEIRPVLDLRRLLGIDTVPECHPRMILLRREGREMGLQIDSVEQIRRISSEDLQSNGNGYPGFSRHIKGSTKDLLMLLSTEALFAELHTGVTT